MLSYSVGDEGGGYIWCVLVARTQLQKTIAAAGRCSISIYTDVYYVYCIYVYVCICIYMYVCVYIYIS